MAATRRWAAATISVPSLGCNQSRLVFAVSALGRQSYFLPIFSSLVVLAWVMLWAWEQSPYGRYLNHAELGNIDRSGDGGDFITMALLYVIGWTLTTVAMMLPTSLPLIEIFRRLTRRRSDHRQLVALLITGYLSIWLGFGVVAHLFDWSLHKAFDRSVWLQSNAWVFGAGPLILAGLFQFTELKYRCLEKCRTPLSFVMQHWRGSGQHLQAFALGVNHGMFCVGCCWALMLLMFAVGTGNVGWMLLLGAIMAVEKNLPWGKKFSTPLGVTLLVWGGLIVFNHSFAWNL